MRQFEKERICVGEGSVPVKRREAPVDVSLKETDPKTLVDIVDELCGTLRIRQELCREQQLISLTGKGNQSELRSPNLK